MPHLRRATPPEVVLFAAIAAIAAATLANAVRVDAAQRRVARIERLKRRKASNLAALDSATFRYPMQYEGD